MVVLLRGGQQFGGPLGHGVRVRFRQRHGQHPIRDDDQRIRPVAAEVDQHCRTVRRGGGQFRKRRAQQVAGLHRANLREQLIPGACQPDPVVGLGQRRFVDRAVQQPPQPDHFVREVRVGAVEFAELPAGGQEVRQDRRPPVLRQRHGPFRIAAFQRARRGVGHDHRPPLLRGRRGDDSLAARHQRQQFYRELERFQRLGPPMRLRGDPAGQAGGSKALVNRGVGLLGGVHEDLASPPVVTATSAALVHRLQGPTEVDRHARAAGRIRGHRDERLIEQLDRGFDVPHLGGELESVCRHDPQLGPGGGLRRGIVLRRLARELGSAV